MTDTNRMVAWLRETLDTAQADAEAAGGDEWRRHEDPSDQVAIYDSKDEVVVYNEGWPAEEQQVHIARHHPAAVLRRIAADRKTVARYEDAKRILSTYAEPDEATFAATELVVLGNVIRDRAEGWGWTEETT